MIYEEAMKVSDEGDTNPNKQFVGGDPKLLFFNLLVPDKHGDTPLDLVINGNSPKSIEIMMEMLVQLPQWPISKLIRKHFSALFEAKGIMNEFLATTIFKNSLMKEPISLQWNFSKDEIFLDYH